MSGLARIDGRARDRPVLLALQIEAIGALDKHAIVGHELNAEATEGPRAGIGAQLCACVRIANRAAHRPVHAVRALERVVAVVVDVVLLPFLPLATTTARILL